MIFGIRLLSMHPVSGCLRLAGSGKDCAGILPDDLEPGCDVGGMIRAWVMGYSQICED